MNSQSEQDIVRIRANSIPVYRFLNSQWKKWKSIPRIRRCVIIIICCILVLLAVMIPFGLRKYYHTLYRSWPDDRQLPIIGGCPAVFVEEQDDSIQRLEDVVIYNGTFKMWVQSNGQMQRTATDKGSMTNTSMGPYPLCYPICCRATVTGIRYLNLLPGDSSALYYKSEQKGLWTHDMMVEIRIEKMFFAAGSGLGEGDTIVFYALEHGKRAGHGDDFLPQNFVNYSPLFFSIPDDYYPYFKTGEMYYIYLYRTDSYFCSNEPFDTTVRSLCDYFILEYPTWNCRTDFKYRLDYGGETFPNPTLEPPFPGAPDYSKTYNHLQKFSDYLGKTREEMYEIDDAIEARKGEKLQKEFDGIVPPGPYLIWP